NMYKAFEAKLERYEHQGKRYRARTGAIKIPSDLAGSVEAVLGLDDRPQAKPHFRVKGKSSAPKVSAAATPISYSPRQVAELYQFPLDVDGKGQAVGILELGGGYKPADLKTYFSQLGIKEPSVTAVLVDNAKNSPTTSDSADAEVLL